MSSAAATISDQPSAAAASTEQSRVLWVGGALAAGLALVLFGFRDLPMLDLPQHAVQLATLLRWEQLPESERVLLELNLRTPYLLAYPLAYALSTLVGVLPALKLIVWLAAVGNVLALGVLARQTRHSPWLCLLGLPLSFGFSFYFGFVSFLLATPLVTVAVAAALAHATRARWQSAVRLAATLVLLLVAHGFAFALGALSVGILLLFGAKPGVFPRVGPEPSAAPPSAFLTAKSLGLRLAPLLAPAAIALFWLSPASHESTIQESALSAERAIRWLPLLLGVGLFRDGVAVALGLAIVVLLALSLGRVAWVPGRLGLLAVATAGYLFIPGLFLATGFLHQRCLVFLLPALLLACKPPSSSGLRRLAPRLVPLVCAVWLVTFAARLSAFNGGMADYHALMAGVPAGLRVRPLIFWPNDYAFPGVPAYLHVSAYYHAEKGGLPAYSFAVSRTSVVRFRDGYTSKLPPGSEWVAERFDAAREASDYDYFLVRGKRASGAKLFEGSPVPIVLDGCRGTFCGYRVSRPPAQRQSVEVGG